MYIIDNPVQLYRVFCLFFYLSSVGLRGSCTLLGSNLSLFQNTHFLVLESVYIHVTDITYSKMQQLALRNAAMDEGDYDGVDLEGMEI